MATTWNPSDKTAGIALSVGNHIATTSAGGNHGVRGSPVNRSTGKWYLEYSNILSGGASGAYGFAEAGLTLGTAPFCAVNPAGVLSGVGTVTLGAVPDGKVISFAIDLDNLRVWARYDGGIWNNSAPANPATNTGGLALTAIPLPIYPYTWLQNSPGHVTINSGDSTLLYAIPSGFTAWDFVLPFRNNFGVVIS